MPGFKGAVFDLCRLLIDSEPIWMWEQLTAFRELGMDLTDAMQHGTTGMGMWETIQIRKVYFLAASIDPDSIRLRPMNLVAGALRASGKPKPGAIRALEFCRTAGCPLTIAYPLMPDIIDAALDRLGARL